MAEQDTLVLKFGGSVLRDDESLARAVHEIYRHVRDGCSVVAVVSALHGETDALAARARAIDEEPEQHAYAALLATGEQTSAALLALAVCRIGLSCEVADASRLQLRARGRSLDAEPTSVDTIALRGLLARVRVVVVPGFVGIDDNGRTALLGRGGSDFTALFLAHALGARCRLVKDVRGLYERDPARPGPLARPFASVRYVDALRLDGRIVQHKAVRFAEQRGVVFEVGAAAEERATVVGAAETRLLTPDQDPQLPLRVAILGFGTVGIGVHRRLRALPHAFAVERIAARSARAAVDAGAPRSAITNDAVVAATADVDVVVEAIGGTGVALEAIEAALSRGRHVVTANKSLLAQHGPRLRALAQSNGARLLFSAAVGGAAPALETVERARRHGRIASVTGILNATSGFVLDQLAHGATRDDALKTARARGFAEADATFDLDGTDAADKLTLCVRATGRDGFQAEHIAKRGVEACDERLLRAARCGEGRVRLVARWRCDGIDGAVNFAASVAPELVSAPHELSFLSADECGVLVRCEDGAEFRCGARGAGRWPTAESVVADLFDLWRDAQRHRSQEPASVEACEEALR